MWLTPEIGRNWIILSWQSAALVGGTLLSVIDGGQRRRHATPLKRIELQSVLQSLPEAVFLFDDQSRIIDVNKVAEELTGQNWDKLLGMDAAALSNRLLSAETAFSLESIIARTLKGEYVRHQTQTIHGGPNRRVIEARVSGNPIYHPSQRPLGALIVIEDISELSALQQQVASSERHFEVGQMTAGLAHDFNNVLGTISQAVYVLEMDPERSEADRTMLTIINNAVRRGAEIVNNIRGYLRGTREMRTRVDMRRLLVEVLQMVEPVLEMHPEIKVTRDIQDACEVYASVPELRRVFTNLVLNALDAMPQGGLLTVHCFRNEGRTIVSVEDTGIGIPIESQGMIFSPYFTTKAKGTGLGLSGARKAIRAQGGEIRFESSPGKGTRFLVSLPIANEHDRRKDRAA